MKGKKLTCPEYLCPDDRVTACRLCKLMGRCLSFLSQKKLHVLLLHWTAPALQMHDRSIVIFDEDASVGLKAKEY